MSVGYVGPRDASEEQQACRHRQCAPPHGFDEDASTELEPAVIRERWPRFEGKCPDCGIQVIQYVSAAHLIAGDWNSVGVAKTPYVGGEDAQIRS